VTVRLRFFASLRELLGAATAERALPAGSTVGDLWGRLCADHPELKRFGGSVTFAVNREYVDREHRLADQDEIALIPPVSGG